jgi:hypothetical protein
MASPVEMHRIEVGKYFRKPVLGMLEVAAAGFAITVVILHFAGVPGRLGWGLTLLVPGSVAGIVAAVALLTRNLGYQEATAELGWEGDLVHYRKVDGSLHSIDLRRVRRVEFSEVEAGDVEFYVEGGDRISLYPGLGYSGKLGMSLLEAIKAWCSKTGRPCHLERRQISRFPRVVFYSLVIGESEGA